MVDLITKDDLLNKLRLYTKTPDNDTIRYKKKIEQLLIGCPELLYAINEHDLEPELFDDDGNINWDSETGEPLGEWDRYFGSNANIRPFLFIPETQPKVKNFICYKIGFNEVPRYNKVERYMQVVFYIYVHGDNRIDKLTGIPRHDLIAAILQEKINWTNLFGTQSATWHGGDWHGGYGNMNSFSIYNEIHKYRDELLKDFKKRCSVN